MTVVMSLQSTLIDGCDRQNPGVVDVGQVALLNEVVDGIAQQRGLALENEGIDDRLLVATRLLEVVVVEQVLPAEQAPPLAGDGRLRLRRVGGGFIEGQTRALQQEVEQFVRRATGVGHLGAEACSERCAGQMPDGIDDKVASDPEPALVLGLTEDAPGVVLAE